MGVIERADMETQISVESEIDLEDENKVNLIKDGKDKRHTHVDVLIIGVVLATAVDKILYIYNNTEKAVIKHPSNNHSGHFEDMFIYEDKYFILPLEHWVLLLMAIGEQFIVPLVYFLSGSNVFFSLFKRNEREFREERVHRLFVPILVMCFLSFFNGFTYFAPLDPVCQAKFEDPELYYNKTTLNFTATKKCNLLYEIVKDDPPFISLIVQTFLYGVPRDIFLLFIFSQCFAFWFSVFHPNQNKQGVPAVPYCGSTTCCCSRKPPYCVARFFCCFHFFCKSASSPAEFVSAVTWYLGGSLRVIVVPGLALFLMDCIMDLPLHVLLGYAIASTESTIVGDLTKKYRWVYLMVGLVFMSVYSVVFLAVYDLDHQKIIEQRNFQPLLYLICAFGSWSFVLGLVSVLKEIFTLPNPIISDLRETAMPFFINFHWVLMIYLSGAFWVPYLRSFPFTVIFGSLITAFVSLLIRKTGPLRYFFGLRCPPNSLLPGKMMRGMIPATVLFVSFTICHFVLYYTKDTIIGTTNMDYED